MALLMVHLLVARKWAQQHPEYLQSPEFYLGAISPDAIHVRDKDDKSHKNEIHLNNWTVLHPDDVIAYWRRHSTPFDVGYGIHVLTDAQWVPRYRSTFPQMVLPDGKLDVSVYYNDTFVTDYRLYRECGGKDLFDLVERGSAPDDHPLLTKFELSEWQKWMVSTYRGECPKSDPVKFIDIEFVNRYIEESQKLLHEIWRRTWNE